MIIFIVLLIITLTSAGQIFLKLGADRLKPSTFINRYVILGYTMFVLTIILSYYLMQKVPMKYFTVVMSLNYIAVMIAAKIFLDEKINKNRISGTIMVAIGVFIFLI